MGQWRRYQLANTAGVALLATPGTYQARTDFQRFRVERFLITARVSTFGVFLGSASANRLTLRVAGSTSAVLLDARDTTEFANSVRPLGTVGVNQVFEIVPADLVLDPETRIEAVLANTLPSGAEMRICVEGRYEA